MRWKEVKSRAAREVPLPLFAAAPKVAPPRLFRKPWRSRLDGGWHVMRGSQLVRSSAVHLQNHQPIYQSTPSSMASFLKEQRAHTHTMQESAIPILVAVGGRMKTLPRIS
jgi:hypothetical protein